MTKLRWKKSRNKDEWKAGPFKIIVYRPQQRYWAAVLYIDVDFVYERIDVLERHGAHSTRLAVIRLESFAQRITDAVLKGVRG